MHVIFQHASPPCHARASWSRACGHASEHQRLDIPRAAPLQCRFPQVAHANFGRCEDDNGVQHPQGSRDSPAGGAQSRAAREAPMYDLTQLTPTVLTLISGRRIPVTKVTEDGGEAVVQVGRGWTLNRTQSSGCAKSTTTRLLHRPRPPHGLAIRQPPCEEMAIFAVRLNVPDATAAAGPPVRLGSWLTSALARAGRELSRAILGSPRDQRTAEEGLPQWPLANEACLTRYII